MKISVFSGKIGRIFSGREYSAQALCSGENSRKNPNFYQKPKHFTRKPRQKSSFLEKKCDFSKMAPNIKS
jgi:hypothetical protein